jgi:hypothetical protein
MKKGMLVAVVVVVSVLAVGAWAMTRKSSIEEPEYRVVRKLGDVELRAYNRMVLAKTDLPDSSFERMSSTGFRTVAGYIFGGNEREEKISMTAPVVMNLGKESSMYFVMPRSYSLESLPKPLSGRVQVVEEGPKTLAVLGFSGYASDAKIREKCALLKQVLQDNGVVTRGDFMYMGYNAPWDLVNRRNEVAVLVVEE